MIQDYVSKKFIKELNDIKANKFLESNPNNYKFESYSLINISNFPKEEFVNYFSKYKMEELIKIREILKKFNLNQLAFFSYALEGKVLLHRDGKKFVSLNKDMHRIKNNLPLTEGPFIKGHSACNRTINGFIRAFESRNIVFSKAIIDGKLKRVFIKTPHGSSSIYLDPSRNFLVLDPQTFKVYNLTHSISNNNNPVFLDLKSLKRLGDLNRFQYEHKVYNNYLKTVAGVLDTFILQKTISNFLNMAYKKDGVLGLTRIKRIYKAQKKFVAKKEAAKKGPFKVKSSKKSIFPKSIFPKKRIWF